MKSEILNRDRARQIIDFAGMRYGTKGAPTDCDGIVEWHDQARVFFELKHGKKNVPVGQSLAFTRLCDDMQRIGKPALFIVAEHDVDDPNVDVIAAESRVREYYFNRRWYKKGVQLNDLINSFLEWNDRRRV